MMMTIFLLPVIIIYLVFAALYYAGVNIRRKLHTVKIKKTIKDGAKNHENTITGRIFRLADKNHGTITLSEVVMETGMDIREAEKTMDKLTDGTRINMEIDEQGIIIYEFPEIIYRRNKIKKPETGNPAQ